MEELVKFLDEIGIKNSTIAILKEPTEGLDIKALADEFKTDSRAVYANDPEVIKELELKAKGKERGSVERKVKKVFNISAEDWAAAELDGDYEKALVFANEKIKKEGTKSVQEINTDLQDANTKLKWYKEEEIPRIEKESSEKVDRNEANRHLRKLIAESGELIVSESATIAVVKEELSRKGYTTALNEGKSDLTIKTQEGLSPQDEGKTRNLTNEEVIKGILEGEKLVKQSRAGTETPKITPAFAQPERKEGDSPELQAAIKNLDVVKDLEKTTRVTAGTK